MRLVPIPQWLYSSSALRLHLDAKSRIHLSAVIPGMQIFIPSAHEGLINQVVITDATIQGKTIYANKAFKRLTGYDPSDVIGKTPRILQGVGTDKKVIGRLAVALKSGKKFQGKTVNYRKEGTPFIMYWRVLPIRVGKTTEAWIAIQREGSFI